MSKLLFLDESGDHNLHKIDPFHPIFVLGGIIVDRKYAFSTMQEKLSRFKIDLFGTDQIILHTADFTRQRNGFEKMKDANFCSLFYKKLNELICSLDIKVVACAIKKQHHFAKYGIDAIGPYHLSLRVLVERFCFELSSSITRAEIIAESRDDTLNRQLDLAWLDIKVSGTTFMQASKINKKISSLHIKTKQENLAGLEIADAVVTPIARKLLHRNSRISFETIKSKIRRNSFGDILGYGLVTLPKK